MVKALLGVNDSLSQFLFKHELKSRNQCSSCVLAGHCSPGHGSHAHRKAAQRELADKAAHYCWGKLVASWNSKHPFHLFLFHISCWLWLSVQAHRDHLNLDSAVSNRVEILPPNMLLFFSLVSQKHSAAEGQSQSPVSKPDLPPVNTELLTTAHGL